MDDPKIKAKKEALRQLQKADFYEPETDNPPGEDHIPMDDEPAPLAPEVTMQSDTNNLKDALSGKSKKKQLEELMKAAKE